eukprot:365362-Chlamydomonas_euryale.AAC.8
MAPPLILPASPPPALAPPPLVVLPWAPLAQGAVSTTASVLGKRCAAHVIAAHTSSNVSCGQSCVLQLRATSGEPPPSPNTRPSGGGAVPSAVASVPTGSEAAAAWELAPAAVAVSMLSSACTASG